MPSKRRIYVCDSHKPKVHGGGCCSDKGSQNLLLEFTRQLHEHNLLSQVELIPTTCLSQCKTGVSVRIWPDQVYYGHVRQGNVSDIVVQHLIQGQPVDALRIDETQTRFAGW